jgi:rod shape-determining protein MreD
MRIVVLLLSTVIAAVLQYYLPGWAFFANARYPFLFAIVLYFGLRADAQFLILSAIIAGGMCDTLSAVPLGYSCVLFGLSALLARNSMTGLSRDGEYVAASLLGAVLIFVIIIIEYFMLTMRDMINLSFSFAFMKGIGNALQALFVVPLTIWFVSRLEISLGVSREKRNV